MTDIFFSCPKGLEALLRDELQQMGATGVRETVAGVYAAVDAPSSREFIYRACLWSRLANRVLMPLAKFPVADEKSLYEQTRTLQWHQIFSPASSLAIDFSGTNNAIRNTQFGAQRVKDAIVDQLRDSVGSRPEIDSRDPDVLINARLSKGQLVISFDMGGGSLHRRGYRREMVPAPLKENLAAALLLRAGWADIAREGGALIDPMCGSGTLLIEGAMMAADIAPSLNRPRFGFQSALDFDEPLWRSVRDEAIERKQQGLGADMPEIRGYDKDTRAIEAAESNILAAGLGQWVRVSPRPIQSFKKPTHKPIESGLVISNPPYGERWGDVDRLRPVYQALGETVKRECPGWRLAVFTGNPDLAGELRLRPEKKYRLFNGTIASELLVYQLKTAEQQSLEPKERPLSEGALMVANRLKKNQAKLSSWVKKEQVSCYRLYDADIPEYAVAIDLYGEAIHVQEYAPPASVDEKLASRRMSDVRRALLAVFPNSGDKIRVKERRRQKGSEQYRKLNTDRRGASKLSGTFLVTERRARLEVNLSDYLDTGLFLDHRPVRQLLAEMAPDKRFLNLFCYTAAATVHAALGTDGEGARESTSVDMSNAYLDWARRNLEHNGLDSARHRLVRSDCLKWLDQADPSRPFDLIFLDPPTFSNSAKMEGVLDIQRDHPALIRSAMKILSPGGTLVFSNNFRKFKMDADIQDEFFVEDITRQTIPPDFARNPKIHNCWLIRHR